MGAADKATRQSVTLPNAVARRVRSLAKAKHTSANRVLVELIERGLEAQEDEKRRFFAVADRLCQSDDPAEQSRLKAELALMTFGE